MKNYQRPALPLRRPLTPTALRGLMVAPVASVLTTPLLAEGAILPASAKQLKGKEISTFLDCKTFNIVIYEADAPITARRAHLFP